MTLEQKILDVVRRLSDEDRQKVLAFAESLAPPPGPVKDSRGMFAHHATVPVTLEMIEQARREMWANFPREFPPDEPS